MVRRRTLTGSSVSTGLALGPVHVVRARVGSVPLWSIPELEVADEIARFGEALERAAEELEESRRIVARQTNEKDAEIFAVHKMILQDPGALKKVEHTISEERINAEAAVQKLIEGFESTLSQLEGNSVRSYASDVTDPWNVVLGVLMNRESESFASSAEKVVLAADELTPQVVTSIERSRILAVITERGGRFSHGAVLARSFDIPCVVELPNLLSRLEQGMRVLVDGDQAEVQLRPEQEDVDRFLLKKERHAAQEEAIRVHAALPPVTPDGRSIRVQVNLESLRDLDTFELDHCDGVGLLRTEFLYLERAQFPSEEEQYRLYRRILERLEGRELTLRTLDIGGDKPLPYFKTPAETNPALGWRGLRIMLEWPDLLRVQLRAALRASAHGPLRILLPMVTAIEEVQQVRVIFDEVRTHLADQGYEFAAEIPVGVMVEVPACLIELHRILEVADFVSVGTNDLLQYLLAVDRDNPLVARRYDPQHPALMWALRHVAEVARAAGKPCAVCGEVAGDPIMTLLLIGMGYTSVSVAPRFVPSIKAAVRVTRGAELDEFLVKVGASGSSTAVQAELEEARERLDKRLRIGEDAVTSADSTFSELGIPKIGNRSEKPGGRQQASPE